MGQPAETRPFTYRYARGQILWYDVSVVGQVEVKTPMGSQTSPLEIAMEIRQTVEAAEPELATVIVEIMTARAVQAGEMATLPEQGQRYVMTVDPRGRVRYVSGSGGWQGSEFAQMLFPKEALRAGDAWVQEGDRPMGAAVAQRTRYTYKGRDPRSSRPLALFDAELLLQSGSGGKVDPNARSLGTTRFDPVLGQVVSTSVDSKFAFTMPLPDDPAVLIQSITTLHTEMTLREGKDPR